jgi:hypothetical protein
MMAWPWMITSGFVADLLATGCTDMQVTDGEPDMVGGLEPKFKYLLSSIPWKKEKPHLAHHISMPASKKRGSASHEFDEFEVQLRHLRAVFPFWTLYDRSS